MDKSQLQKKTIKAGEVQLFIVNGKQLEVKSDPDLVLGSVKAQKIFQILPF